MKFFERKKKPKFSDFIYTERGAGSVSLSAITSLKNLSRMIGSGQGGGGGIDLDIKRSSDLSIS